MSIIKDKRMRVTSTRSCHPDTCQQGMNCVNCFSSALKVIVCQARGSGKVVVCAQLLGRKPQQQQHGLIVYQPVAFNKDLLKSQTVDNTSSMVHESEVQCNSEEKKKSPVPVVSQFSSSS